MYWLTSLNAHAAGGEAYIGVISAHEIAVLYRPDLSTSSSFGAVTYVPRFGANTIYALTRRVRFGIEATASLPQNVVSHDVHYQAVLQGELVARYQDVMLLPFVLQYSFESGADWAWHVGIATGIRWAHWQDVALHSPLDYTAQLPFESRAGWQAAWLGQIRTGGTWRPTDHVMMQVGLYLGMAQQGDTYAGVSLSGGWMLGAGPALY